MAKGIGKGNGEGSQKALDENRGDTRFTAETGHDAGVRSGEMRRAKAKLQDITLKWKLDRAELYDDTLPKAEIKRRATDDNLPQHKRIDAIRALNPKTAREDMKDLEEWANGKPTQPIDNNIAGSLDVSKPSIVFNDVEGASRKGEEERLQSEEEDI